MRICRLFVAFSFATATTTFAYAQNTYPWPSTGNVGIGTTSPTSTLSVYKSGANIDPSLTYGAPAAVLFNHASIELAMGTQNNNPYAWWMQARNWTGGAHVLSLNPLGGNVGIGTTNPSTLLDIRKDQNSYTIFRVQNRDTTNTDSRAYAQIIGGSNELDLFTIANGPSYVRTATNSDLKLGTNDTDRLTLYTNGYALLGAENTADYEFRIGRSSIHHAGYNSTYNGLLLSSNGFDNGQQNQSLPSWFLDLGGRNALTGIDCMDRLTIARLGAGASAYTQFLSIMSTGNVGIGTTNPSEKLSVKGKIRAQEVIVETAGWSDHVFADSYPLASLAEVEQHIKTEKHLPGVPSAQEVAEKGVSVGDMQAILLAKIEELTLHQIAQEKKQIAQDAKLESQAVEIAALKAENAQLKIRAR